MRRCVVTTEITVMTDHSRLQQLLSLLLSASMFCSVGMSPSCSECCCDSERVSSNSCCCTQQSADCCSATSSAERNSCEKSESGVNRSESCLCRQSTDAPIHRGSSPTAESLLELQFSAHASPGSFMPAMRDTARPRSLDMSHRPGTSGPGAQSFLSVWLI